MERWRLRVLHEHFVPDPDLLEGNCHQLYGMT